MKKILDQQTAKDDTIDDCLDEIADAETRRTDIRRHTCAV